MAQVYQDLEDDFSERGTGFCGLRSEPIQTNQDEIGVRGQEPGYA